MGGGSAPARERSFAADVYTETKVVAEKFVLSQNGTGRMLTCSIRPSGIWGRGDQTMFRTLFKSVLI